MVGLTHRRGVALLVVTTVLWATTFALQKTLLDTIPASLLIGVRFAITAVAALPLLRGITPALARDALLASVLMFASFVTQILGLRFISANRSAFLVSLNVVIVPMLAPIFGRRIPFIVFGAALMAAAGTWLMSGEGASLGVGDLYALGSATSFALYIILLEKIAPRHAPYPLFAAQMMLLTLYAAVWAIPDYGSAQAWAAIREHWLIILYLGIGATGATVLLQTIAQRVVPAFEAALVYALEPVFATVFAWLTLGERLGRGGVIGAVLILAATIIVQFRPSNAQDDTVAG
jgi:drug/metabolite transporter (DMT)-like permease